MPLLPLLGGGVYPSPILPPLGLDGAPRDRFERPRWLKMAPRGAPSRKMASKMAQDTSRWVKIASDIPPRGPKTAPRRIQVPFEPSTAPSKMPKPFKSLREINVFGILAFSLPMGFGSLKMAPRWPKRAPRGAQEGPRRPQDRPRGAQERSKTAPRRRLRASEGGTRISHPPFFEPWGPRWPQEASQPLPKTLHPALFGPRWLQESPR